MRYYLFSLPHRNVITKIRLTQYTPMGYYDKYVSRKAFLFSKFDWK